MAKMRHYTVTIPNDRRPSPRFGLGNLYRHQRTGVSLGNLFRAIPLSFYREAPSPLPFEAGTDLLGRAPLPFSSQSDLCGQSCPHAMRSAPGNGHGATCAHQAAGQPCPFTKSAHAAGLGRMKMPRFGLGSLGQTTLYTDTTTGYSVDSNGYIWDPSGSDVWDPTADSGQGGNFGPFQVTDSNLIYGPNGIIWPVSASTQTVPVGPSQPSGTATGKQIQTTGSIFNPLATPGGQAQPSGSSFFASPTGYAAPGAQPTAPTPSFWNQKTTLFGSQIPNTDLIAGLAVGAIALTMLRKKR